MLLAGCSQNDTLTSGFTTGSIDPQQQAAAKAQEATCLTLASQIEALNADGVSEKVEKAAGKKYKLKPGDITKADELNKANNEFQAKCSSYPPKPTVAAAEPAAPAATKSAAKPPLPAAKSVTAAVAPDATSTGTSVTTTTSAPTP